ncbi:MAG: site-specific integrase [Phycisphaerae bacterium]|nr:site-specific integrase [Phycisphaerae bacterium]
MASIGWEGKDGDLAKLKFRDAAGKQKGLRVGKCSKAAARTALAGFERVLESYRLGCTLHPDGVAWLAGLDSRVYARVVALGLCQPRADTAVVSLGKLLEQFDSTAVVKAGTRTTYAQALDMLREYFGERKPIDTITPADADTWRKAIGEPVKVKNADGTETTKQLAPATIAKRVRVAKSVFAKAVRWGWIASNPFAHLRAGSQSNPDRAHYVDPKAIRAILAACPDYEWRAIIGLSRYAGLRCPSEIVALRWGDVNWERGRLNVRSPKTAGHEGHAVRVVPIAPELRPILQDLFDRAEIGVEAVVPRLRDGSINLRTQFERIIAKAGEKSWPRLFHNMRASCATEWAAKYPARDVAAWLGHSPLIAAQHYLQAQDVYMDLAAAIEKPATKPAPHARPSDTTRDHDENRRDHRESEKSLNTSELVECGRVCDRGQKQKTSAGAEVMTPMGFEPMYPP